MPDITEDDVYRASTQYRLWSFTRQSLASLRTTTNAIAAEAVRAAIKNVHHQKTKINGDEQDDDVAVKVDCLTVEEEQRILGYYCFKTMQFADHCQFGTTVKVWSRALILTKPAANMGLSTSRPQPSNTSSVSTSPIPP